MTVTLNLPPDVERAYQNAAQARGLPLDEIVREVVLAAQPPSANPEMSAEEWVRQFQAWMRSHSMENLPLLSDEAISRESIYGDRGL